MMKLYPYEVKYDTGFAPNPFYGFCTLATCRPDIRGKKEGEGANLGDWVIGFRSEKNKLKGKLVYAMEVTDRLTFDQYFTDERFCNKKPTRDSWQQKRGDNIYEPDSDEPLPSFHHTKKHKQDDKASKNVLISNNYVYFGADGPSIPELKGDDGKSLLHELQNNKQKDKKPLTLEDEQMIEEFKEWINKEGLNGYVGNPLHHDWDWAWPGC